MLLAVDIGNSNIKTGIFHDESLEEFHLFTDPSEIFYYLQKTTYKSVAVSSVVPAKLEAFKTICREKFNLEPFVINKFCKFNLKVEYESFETLGIDRLCACEGAFKIFRNKNDLSGYNEKTQILTIDFGTATTVNFIEYPGKFSGGIIAPGIKMMFQTLNLNTAQLPIVETGNYNGLIGKTTKSSIASGVINSCVGLIETAVNFLQTERSAGKINIYVTGGNAKAILPHLKMNYKYVEGLVLHGIKAVWDKNMNL